MPAEHSLLLSNYYTLGLLARGIGFAISCLGAFLGLRCASRARACVGRARARWLLLAGVAAGAVGFWATDFIGMLGSTVPGQTIRYNVPVTAASLVIAVVVMCAGLLIAALRRPSARTLVAGSVIAGLGVAFMHYVVVAAMRISARVTYNASLVVVSVLAAVLAAAAVLWAASRLRGRWAALGGAVIVGMVVSGMHDAGVAAVRLSPASAPAGMIIGGSGGATAGSFLLPLFIGVAVLVFLAAAAIALSPTEEEMRYDQSLIESIRGRSRPSLDTAGLNRARGTARGGATARSSPPW